MNIFSDIFGSSGFWSALSTIGSSLGESSKQDDLIDYYQGRDELSAQLEREKLAQMLEIAKLNAAASGRGAGATVQAANINAQSAEKRAKLEALMNASGRRIDSNFTGTGQKLAIIQDMLRSYGG